MPEAKRANGAEKRSAKKRGRDRLEKAGYFAASFAILLAAWELALAAGFVDDKLFPSPRAVCEAGLAGFGDGALQAHMYASFLRVLTGFSVGIALAVLFGFLIGWFRPARLILEPAINFFRALPPIALIPLMIILFGIGETSKIVVLCYAAFFPALVVIYQALTNLDPVYIRAAKTLGATNFEIFRKVVVPQLLPHIVTACRVSLGVCWATLVAAELIAAQKGIGAMMVDAQNFFQMAPLVLGILLIGAISLAMDAAVKAIERKATSWQEKMA